MKGKIKKICCTGIVYRANFFCGCSATELEDRCFPMMAVVDEKDGQISFGYGFPKLSQKDNTDLEEARVNIAPVTTTACATPPATAKFLPSVEASLTPSGSSSMFSRSTCFASKIPAISSKVSTKSTSLRTLRRIASSFLAAHGPIKTTFAFGLCFLIRRAVNVIGVSAMEIQLA